LLLIYLLPMVDVPVVFPCHYALVVEWGGGGDNLIMHVFYSPSLRLDTPPILGAFVNNQPESETVKTSVCYVG
jgi:hypothetical protein